MEIAIYNELVKQNELLKEQNEILKETLDMVIEILRSMQNEK